MCLHLYTPARTIRTGVILPDPTWSYLVPGPNVIKLRAPHWGSSSVEEQIPTKCRAVRYGTSPIVAYLMARQMILYDVFYRRFAPTAHFFNNLP
ncbi:MAG: hypothetical protein JWP71_264 [Mucilaginibacter sp.]|nr:hypothetical protein [Mucilaginibacter sp.]